jgi:dodecin
MVERSSPFFPPPRVMLFRTEQRVSDIFITLGGLDASLRSTKRVSHSHTRGHYVCCRVTEITSSSPKSFDEAMRAGLARANKTLENVSGAWIKNQEMVRKNGKITEYHVRMKVTFVLND